jgi:hypothetical protein
MDAKQIPQSKNEIYLIAPIHGITFSAINRLDEWHK